MSGLFGGKSQSTSDQRLNAIQVTQSAYGNVVPLVYGKTRIPAYLFWYNSFQAIPHTSESGGKGGGGGVKNTSYTYTAAVVLGLCEGDIQGVGTAWADKNQVAIADLGLTQFAGTSGQTPWSFLTSNYPAQAIGYDRTAYLAGSSFDLGSSAGLPNLSFEVKGLKPYSAGALFYEAEPSEIITDYCTHATHGAGFNALGTLTGTNSYRDYCTSMGFFLSPAETVQRQAADFIAEILQITNSNAVWSAGTLKIIPYCDAPVGGNGATYTPNLTPLFSFSDDDYVAAEGSDPVICERVPASQTYNRVRVEYLDAANQYNTAIAEAEDAQDVALFGVRAMQTLSFHSITSGTVARLVAQLILQRQLYTRNKHTFSTRIDYSLLEPMDIVAINESGLGLTNVLCRVVEVNDKDDDLITLTVEELLVGPGGAPQYNWQLAQGYAQNYNQSPGSVQTPQIIIAPTSLVEGNELMLAICGPSGNGYWGGAHVYMSLDNVTYNFVGTQYGAASYGTLTASLATSADPDTTHTLAVQLADTQRTLGSGTTSDADQMRMLALVGDELVSYQTATLTGAGAYNITYLRRGCYKSTIAAHSSGERFIRVDGRIFRIPFDAGWLGRTVYFKFTSFNIFGQATQDISSATAYSKTINNLAVASDYPTSFTLFPSGYCSVNGRVAWKSGGASAWDSAVRSLESYYAGAYVKFSAAQANKLFMIGLNSDPATDSSYTSLDFAWYCHSSGDAYIYESAANLGTFGIYTPASVFAIEYDGQTVRYLIDGVVKRAVPAANKRFYLDSSFADPDARAKDIDFGTLTGVPRVGGNFLNVASWVIGTADGQGNFGDNFDGTNHDSSIVLAGTSGNPLGPHGESEPIWKTVGAGAGANGGWNNSVDCMGIDPTKTYRSTVWCYWNGTGNPSIYHGCDTANTNDLSGAANSNPYYIGGSFSGMGLKPGKWYLMVGILHGSGYGSTDSGMSGIYDRITGQRAVAGLEYKIVVGAAYQQQRVYQYYANNGSSVIWFAKPRFEEMNGHEPSLAALLVLPDADNSLKQRVIPDSEFEFATDQTFWYWGSQAGFAISPTGGVLGGVLQITFDGTTKTLIARGGKKYRYIPGQQYMTSVRMRRTSALGGTGISTSWECGSESESADAGTAGRTSTDSAPVEIRVGGLGLNGVQDSLPVLNQWYTFDFTQTAVIDASNTQPYLTAHLFFGSGTTSGTIEVDALQGIPLAAEFTASQAGTVAPPGAVSGLVLDDAGSWVARAALASPAFTGTPTVPTASGGTNTTQAASTAFVQSEISTKAPLASPALTGTPTAPTAAAGTQTTQLATTAFVDPAHSIGANGYVKLSSGVLIQWGTTSSVATNGTAAVSFPITFPNNVFSVTLGGGNNSAAAKFMSASVQNGSLSASGFTAQNNGGDANAIMWMAIGN